LKQDSGRRFFSSKLETVKLKLLLLFAVFLFTAFPAWSGINQWTSNGPVSCGTVSSVAVSPNYAEDKTVFAAAGTFLAGSVVYKSTDGE